MNFFQDWNAKTKLHFTECLECDVISAFCFGSIYSAYDITSNHKQYALRQVGKNIGILYAIGALVCPMEVATGRRTVLHNFVSGAIVGGVAAHQNWIHIPIVPQYQQFATRYPMLLSNTLYGAVATGLFSLFLVTINGKSIWRRLDLEDRPIDY
jgi:hypothetical protein